MNSDDKKWSNKQWLEDRLKDMESLIDETKKLLVDHPNDFALKVSLKSKEQHREELIKKINGERGVSYLIFIGILLSLAMFSVFWMFTSDLLDLIHPIFGSIMGMNSVTDDGWNYWGFDALFYMFGMLVILAPIGIMWYAYQKAQKPMDLYG